MQFLIIFVYFYNPFYLLTYTLVFILLLVGSYSDFWAKHISPHLHQWLFREGL